MVYTIIKFFFPILEKLFIKRIDGVENIPSYGPFIIVANHQSHLDGFFLAGHVIRKTNQPIRFLAKQEFTSYFGSWIEDIVYKKWGQCILVEKEGTKEKGKLAIAEAATTLEDDGIVGIFPEGTRTYDGSLQEGRTGVIRIVLEAQEHLKRSIPIIPIGIKGANILLPRKKILPRIWKSRVTITIGKPFYMNSSQKNKEKNNKSKDKKRNKQRNNKKETRKTKPMTKALLRKQTTIIMKKIAACAGVQYDP